MLKQKGGPEIVRNLLPSTAEGVQCSHSVVFPPVGKRVHGHNYLPYIGLVFLFYFTSNALSYVIM